MTVPHPTPADRGEAFARARAALDRESDPAVIRAWSTLFAEAGRDDPPAPHPRFSPELGLSPALARDLRLLNLALLLGAQARA